MRNSLAIAVLLASVVLVGIISAQDGPDSVIRGTKRFDKKVLVSGLAGPWELTWGPDNMLWVTERRGKSVTRIDPMTGELRVAITIDEVSAPGPQQGLLGMAMHPELLKYTGNDYVYVAYTYVDKEKGPHPTVTDPASPYRYLYGKIVRLTYSPVDQTLSHPMNIITGLPAGDDHVGGRLKFGPDKKLYFPIGDQGHNQSGNFCLQIEAQRLPTQREINDKNYDSYVGKSLRVDLDGSIPSDNPKLNGVVSHVFTYGHRNPQGLDFGPDGTLYSSEHGPKTDDEINILTKGGNYGWPHVAGFQDNKAYVYANWSQSTTPCSQLKYEYNDFNIPLSVPQEPESAFTEPFVNPIATMFTVPTGYNFQDPACKGVDSTCWPSVGPSDVEYYESKGKGIPGWDKVLLVTTLKRGSLYVLPLSSDGKAPAGHFSRYRTIYIATDPHGVVAAADDVSTRTKMENPSVILAFTYTGEDGPGAEQARAVTSAKQSKDPVNPAPSVNGDPPSFTTAQAARGKAASLQLDTSDSTPLRALAERRGISIGAAVFSAGLSGGYYASVLAREFNMVTAENEMKFDVIEPAPDVFNFVASDAIVDFAKSQGMLVRGHTLVWHQQLPEWVTNGKWNRRSLLGAMQNHIAKTVGRYKGGIAYWDVVNEAVNDNYPHKLRDTIWRQTIGDDYIDEAFKVAHQADPAAKLFYNDYGVVEGLNTKATAIYELVQGMLARGVPIHGVGLQMHIDTTADLRDFAANIKRFTDLGLEVQITELDVRIPSPGKQQDLEAQAETYYRVVKEALGNPKVTAVVLWGFTDGYTWIPKHAPWLAGFGEPLVFDAAYNKKLAYYGLHMALK